jgi:isopenicillin N synthase-like dioxygenase
MQDLLPGYRAVVERYFEAMGQLAQRMLRLLAIGLGLPADYFAPSFDRPIFSLRPLHYRCG